MFKYNPEEGNVIKSIFLAYFILIFHVGLLAVLGILVLFFSGIVNYLVWIMLGAGALLAGSGYMLIRHLKKQSGSLVKIFSQPEFRGKNVEVSLMGGLASIKVSGPEADTLRIGSDQAARQLEDPEAARYRELAQLAGLLDKELITREEYYRAKQKLLDQ